jgi:hypothetical protein
LPDDRDNLGLSKYRQPAASTFFFDDFRQNVAIRRRRNDSGEQCGKSPTPIRLVM